MRSKDIGDFSFFNSYMSQPKSQLQTFSAWAGVDSDISYYLNSHHVSLD
jgi:D-galacturonate reductase